MSDYEIRHEIPNVDDYIQIRLDAGLSRKSEQAATVGLSNSIVGVVAYGQDKPIGIGRIIGDGGCFFQIVDIAVVPEHQKKGVGDLIMQSLMTFIYTQCPPTAYISLIADHGTPEFYRRYGFISAELPKSAGMYLRIPSETS